VHRGRFGFGNPIAVRNGARMNTSNDTNALTGLPGSVMMGVPFTAPAPCGMPGRMATLTKSTSPPSASFTTLHTRRR
jgi:hypothetical protein